MIFWILWAGSVIAGALVMDAVKSMLLIKVYSGRGKPFMMLYEVLDFVTAATISYFLLCAVRGYLV